MSSIKKEFFVQSGRNFKEIREHYYLSSSTKRIIQHEIFFGFHIKSLLSICTVCPRSLGPIDIVTYYIKWARTSWKFPTLAELFILSRNKEHKGYLYSSPPALSRSRVICGVWPVSLMICSLPVHARVRDGLSHSLQNCIWYKENKYVY